jgi:alpha-L-rhamnosidase
MQMKFLPLTLMISLFAMQIASAATVGDLRCESRSNPVGIDLRQPQLSWIIASDRRGEIQTAYQVLVASTPDQLAKDSGDLWDSGRVASNTTAQVPYGGRPLASSAACFWKVRVWDRDGKRSEWSPPASWTMGLLAPADWHADWITDAMLADPANRPLTPIHCYRSELTARPDAVKWIVLDIGSSKRMDAIELIAARPARENSDFRTVMFPTRFKIEAADDQSFGKPTLLVDNTASDFPDPRKAVSHFQFPATTARYVRLTVTGLSCWDGQEYGLALGGLVVFDGKQPVSTGAAVECSDSIESDAYSKAFLVAAKPAVKLVDSPALDAGMPDTIKKFTVSRVPMLRREFNVGGKVRRATVSASARGMYELRVNGKRVSNDLLAPGFVDFNARLQYQTYDVTSLVRSGPNAIGAMLGYGWYAGHMNLFEMRCIYGYFPQLLAQLDVELEDGTHITIGTDRQWRSTLEGPVRWSDLLDGEGYDCNREMPGWDEPGFDDRATDLALKPELKSEWNPVWSQPRNSTPLVWDRCQPVQAVGEIRPVKVVEAKPGVYVLDFGQELTGWCRLKIGGPVGTHLRLRYAEMIKPDGNIDVTTLMGTQQRDDFILDGKGERNLEPHFTYHAFRYVELSGLTPALKPGEIVDAVAAVNVRTAAAVNGQFECSNPLYNQIQKAAQWTQANLLFDVPAGCAARAERLAWMGDIRPCVQSLLFNFDSAALLTKYVNDIRDDQLPDGRFTDIAPHAHLTGTLVCVGTPGWADAGVSLPWDLYVNTGDKRMLAEHYEAAKRWVDSVHASNSDLLWLNQRGQNWGDWLSAGSPITPIDLGSTAFFAHSVDQVSRMAMALDRREDAEQYQALFQDIRRAFVKHYVSDKGIITATADDVAPRNATARDVTATVRSLIKDDRLSVTVTNDALGGDPAPNRVKNLHLSFRRGEQTEDKDFAEKDAVELAGGNAPLQIISATYGPQPDDFGDAQGSYALALHFGLLDEPLRSLAARRLDQLVIRNKFHPTTGFWSSIELLLALSDNGYHADAAEMVDQHDEPSWGYMANFNTTFWESFNADKTKISLDHWPHSAITQWLWNNVAGLSPDEANPGYQSFNIFPRPTQQVSWCKATFHSIRGPITCNWDQTGSTFTLALTVPPNCTATVYLPASDSKNITEAGLPLDRVEGITLLRVEKDRVVLRVVAGSYRLVTKAR